MDLKNAIIQEYLKGGVGLRALEKKYQISRTTISRWVQIHQGIHDLQQLERQQIQYLRYMKDAKKQVSDLADIVALQEKIALLEKQLEWEKQRANALGALIDVAEKQFNIPIRKKSGSSQSGK